MPSTTEWRLPPSIQPRPEDYAFDLDRALKAVVGLHATVTPDAFTADTLGTERAGHGVLIDEDLVLTIGYLITEAATVWIHLHDGRVVEGDALGFDAATGFGLVQVIGQANIDPLPLGVSDAAKVGDRIILAGHGGRARSLAGRIMARQEFAGYWEYYLEDAIFTHPAHPNWGGAGLISEAGTLIGIGSLQLERPSSVGKADRYNMVVPTDLLKPILDDLRRYGGVNAPPRPWLGLYATEAEDKVLIAGVATRGPASRAELREGDAIIAVAGQRVSTLADLYRAIWALGPAGVDVPLTLHRDGLTFDVAVVSSDRAKFLKGPRLQ